MKTNYIQIGQKNKGRYLKNKRAEFTLAQLEDFMYQYNHVPTGDFKWYDKLFRTDKWRRHEQNKNRLKYYKEIFNSIEDLIEVDGDMEELLL